MKWRTVSVVCVALLIAVAAVWVAHGRQVYTKTARQVTVKDDLFGTESVAWEDGFWLGLDVAGPCAGVLAAVAAFGLFRSRRARTTSRDARA